MIDENSDKTFIIAEAGINHNGHLDLAKKLVDAAFEAGADAVKFQAFKADSLVSKFQDKAQHEVLKQYELSFEDYKILFDYCQEKGIYFLSSIFDEQSADFLDDLGMNVFKLASGELTNLPLLEHISKKDVQMILSTGMSDIEEVAGAVYTVQKYNKQPLILLHCVSEYPTPPEETNLLAMETLEVAFHTSVGLSDHSLGIEIPIAAVALGASVIEKHLTLDPSMEGGDHFMSLDPKSFKQMVTSIRNVEKALGDGLKKPSAKEQIIRSSARKGLVAKIDIPLDIIITADMITAKRPGHGIPPKYFDLIVGKKLKQSLAKDESISWDVLLS